MNVCILNTKYIKEKRKIEWQVQNKNSQILTGTDLATILALAVKEQTKVLFS